MIKEILVFSGFMLYMYAQYIYITQREFNKRKKYNEVNS